MILWAGYPFSRDYNKPRGHAFAVTDVRETLRTGAPKTLKMVRYRWRAGVVKAGCGASDQKDGEDGYFHGKWARGGPKSSTT